MSERFGINKRNGVFVLSTGRKFTALCDIVGIDVNAVSIGVCVGYDKVLLTDGWTPEERAELADAMIARWQRWKEQGDE